MQGEPPLSNSRALAQVESGSRTPKLEPTGSLVIPGMRTIAGLFLVSPVKQQARCPVLRGSEYTALNYCVLLGTISAH